MIKRIIAACVIALGSLTLVGSTAATATATTPCAVRMVEWGVNAPGTDTPANANYEFRRFYNPGPAAINVEGWYTQDAYPHVYTLKASALPASSPFRAEVDATHAGDEFVMPAGSNVYVYNGTGTDGNPTNLTAALYANLGHHFNNSGDTLSLRDSGGASVDWVTYTPYRVRHAC